MITKKHSSLLQETNIEPFHLMLVQHAPKHHTKMIDRVKTLIVRNTLAYRRIFQYRALLRIKGLSSIELTFSQNIRVCGNLS